MTDVEVHPLTPGRWDDFEALFGPRGAYDGCWCMFWRLTSAEYSAGRYENNRAAMRALVDAGSVPGLLAYLDGRAVGWVSIAPRPEFGRLERSRTLKPVDDQPVWSIVCFYVDRSARGTGVARALLDAAVAHARANGAELVEGYPIGVEDGPVDAAEAYTGVPGMFDDAGFEEIARRGRRGIVRRHVSP